MNEHFWQLLGGETLYFLRKDFVRIPQNELDFEGGFEKKVLICYKKALSETDRTLLFNILNAVKLTIKDVALLDLTQKEEFDIWEAQDLFDAQKVIAFGINEGETLYQVQEIDNISILYAHELAQFHDSPAKKKDFWLSLKKLFQL